MTKFEMEKSYYVKEDKYYLEFLCTRRSEKEACFMLTKIKIDVELNKCPILFPMLQDFYQNFHGNMKAIYTTKKIEKGEPREVVFSDYENYLWIDSNNLVKECI